MKNLKSFLRRYRRNRASVAGLIAMSVILSLTCFAGVITPYPPLLTMVAEPLLEPSEGHPMGTDQVGRDVFSGVLYGTRFSLMVGVLAAAISFIVGTPIGALAGYYGGIIDDLLMRITEFFLIFPSFVLALLIISIFGSSVWNLVLVIGLVSWPSTARIMRSQYLSLKTRDFVEAARSVGVSDRIIIFNEILPNALVPAIVNTSFQVVRAILMESGLSFLGLGSPEVASWGQMISAGRPYMRQAWWIISFPGLALFITAIALNLIGDGLNDALNPKLG